MANSKLLVPVERVEKTILLVRGQKVILDADLAKLYGVTTKRLNQQVKRNSDRFPEDFMFRLTQKELQIERYAITARERPGDTLFHPSEIASKMTQTTHTWHCLMNAPIDTFLQFFHTNKKIR